MKPNSISNPIPEYIRDLKYLNLTRWGQIRLSAFNAEAIAHADGNYRYANNIKDPFAWFFSQCLQYCKDNGLEPNWLQVSYLANIYGMPKDANMVLSRKAQVMLLKKQVTNSLKITENLTTKAFGNTETFIPDQAKPTSTRTVQTTPQKGMRRSKNEAEPTRNPYQDQFNSNRWLKEQERLSKELEQTRDLDAQKTDAWMETDAYKAACAKLGFMVPNPFKRPA